MSEETGKRKHRRLVFELTTDATLNQNRMPSSHFVKSELARNLRALGRETGLKLHQDSEKASLRAEAIHSEQEASNVKGKIKRSYNKKLKRNPDLKAEMEEALEKAGKDLLPEVSSSDMDVDYEFNHYSVTITVMTPTKRRTDPPNFYPTVKHLIDGLTDASWWEDDSFGEMDSMTFRYGGVSPVPKHYIFVLDIKELSDEEVNSMRDEFTLDADTEGADTGEIAVSASTVKANTAKVKESARV